MGLGVSSTVWKPRLLSGALLLVVASLSAQGDDLHPPRLLHAGGEPIVLDGTWSAAPLVQDWDGDGLDDLIVGDSTGGRLRIYRNIGKRTAPEYDRVEWLRIGDDTLWIPTPPC